MKIRHFSILLASLCLALPTLAADDPTPSRSPAVAKAKEIRLEPSLLGPHGSWSTTLHEPGAAFLKARFESVQLRAGDVLRVLDADGREIERIEKRGPAEGRDFWGLSVPGERMILQLKFKAPYADPPFRVTKLLLGDRAVLSSFVPSLAGPAKSICEPAEFTDAVCSQGDAGRWSNVLATAGILEVTGDEAFFCTGVNVSPRNLVLTTESCLGTAGACENAEFVFGQYRENCGSGEIASNWQSYRCAETLEMSPFGNLCEPTPTNLDFSLHRVDGEPTGTWGYADPDPTPLSSGEGLYIVQHADGRPLEITEGSGADVVVDGLTLRYFGSLDTESSSVGAPVFREADDRLVALHHCGGCASPTLGNRGVMMEHIEPLIAQHLCTNGAQLEAAGGDYSPMTGNGDSVLDPGETWQFTPKVRNVSCTVDTTGVSATFEASAGSVAFELPSAVSTFGDIAAGQVVTGSPLQFTLDGALACDGEVIFDLVSVTSNEGSFAGQTDLASKEIGEIPFERLLFETFNQSIPPAWTVDSQGTGDGEGATWTTDDPGQRNLFDTPYAIVDSEFLGPGSVMDERLISPPTDTTGFTGVTLRFDHQFRRLDGEMDEKADVEARSSATSGAWTPVLAYQGADSSGEQTADLTTVSATDLEIRFRYYDAEWEWWWALDDVEILGDNGRVCFTGIFFDGFESGDTSAWTTTNP